jgi:putative alpha-1,2-mannosidase
VADPGYFSISLANGVKAEMTTTNRSALYRFTFDGSTESLSPVILVDLMDLPQSRSNGHAAVDSNTGRLTGNGTFSPSFGIGSYNLYFCVDFKGADLRNTGVWSRNRANYTVENVMLTADGTDSAATLSAGTFAQFKSPENNEMLARVGVSFMNANQACANAEREQPDFDFDGTVSAAKSAWRKKLDVISVDAEGVSKDMQEIFWSGAYRAMISPQDYTGENPLWESDEPYYDSYYWYVLNAESRAI